MPPDDDFDKLPWVRNPDRPQPPPDEEAPLNLAPLGFWDAGNEGDELFPPDPREWIMGGTFCRGFLSSLVSEGGSGKTALRMTQAIAVATGRQLTHEKVIDQTTVLYVSLEDDANELKRRLRAALKQHNVSYADIRGKLWLASPSDNWKTGDPISSYTLAYSDRSGQVKIGAFRLSDAIMTRKFGLVIIDPFVKLHGLNENSNAEIDFICRVLAAIAKRHNVAIDILHHTSKLTEALGIPRSNRARGGSAFRDAVRLMYTLSPMTAEEGAELNVNDQLRRSLVRLDPGKVNITVPAEKATWYRLVGVNIENGKGKYPDGDNVQAIVPWYAPDLWKDIVTVPVANEILDALDQGLPDGRRYTLGNPDDEDLHAWRLLKNIVPELSEAQARRVLDQWKEEKLIESRDYKHAMFRGAKKGIYVLRRVGGFV